MQACSLGQFIYDPETGEIRRGETCVRLRHKTNAILQYLLQHAGEPVSRDTLFAVGWQQTVLQNAAINKVIAEIRTAFEDDAKNPAYLKTIPKLGYQWVGPTPQAIEASEDAPVKGVPQLAESTGGRETRLKYGNIALIVIVAVALVAWWIWPREQAAAPAQRIAILPLLNQTTTDSVQPFVAGLPDAVAKQLALLGFKTVPVSEVQAHLPQTPAQLDLAPQLFQSLASSLDAAEVVVAKLEKQNHQLILSGKIHTRNQPPQPFQIVAQDGDQLGMKWARTLVRMFGWRKVQQQFAVLQPQTQKGQLYFWDGLQQLLNGQVQQARASLAFGLELEPEQIGLKFLYKEAALQSLCGYRDLYLPQAANCADFLARLRNDPLLESQRMSGESKGQKLGLYGDVLNARMARLLGHVDRAAKHLERTPKGKTPDWLVGMWLAERATVAAELGHMGEAEHLLQTALEKHRQAAFPYSQAAYSRALAALANAQNSDKAASYTEQARAIAALVALDQ